MTECSMYICIFFDLYRIITSLPRSTLPLLPPLLAACTLLAHFSPPPPPAPLTHFQTSYEHYTLFSHRGRKANASPLFALIIQSVCSECEQREQRQRENVRKAVKKTASSWSGHLGVFRLRLNLSFGWHFHENVSTRASRCSTFLSFSHLYNIYTSALIVWLIDSQGWQNLQGLSRISFIKYFAYQPPSSIPSSEACPVKSLLPKHMIQHRTTVHSRCPVSTGLPGGCCFIRAVMKQQPRLDSETRPLVGPSAFTWAQGSKLD